jgi:hypothetical protein
MSGRKATAAFWWRCAGDTFEKVLKEYLTRAKAADLSEKGHDCGHEFTITVSSRGHSSGIFGEPDSPHSDANYSDSHRPVTVRAHNLRDALLLAAAQPLSAWFDEDEDEDEDEELDEETP